MPWHLTDTDSGQDAHATTVAVAGDLSEDDIFYLEGDLLQALNSNPQNRVTLDLRGFAPSDFSLFAGLYAMRKRIRSEHPLRIVVKPESEAAHTLRNGRFSGIFEVVEEA